MSECDLSEVEFQLSERMKVADWWCSWRDGSNFDEWHSGKFRCLTWRSESIPCDPFGYEYDGIDFKPTKEAHAAVVAYIERVRAERVQRERDERCRALTEAMRPPPPPEPPVRRHFLHRFFAWWH